MADKRARPASDRAGRVGEALQPKRAVPGSVCPYLHTVDRSRIDFDAQHICSVSLSSQNTYACLVCGLFFRGKGTSTEAHAHALDASHHVFMRLKDGSTWCLPGETDFALALVLPFRTQRVWAICHPASISQPHRPLLLLYGLCKFHTT